jgi:hypothetical protein
LKYRTGPNTGKFVNSEVGMGFLNIKILLGGGGIFSVLQTHAIQRIFEKKKDGTPT